MEIIRARGLTKEFKIFRRREGVKGAFRDLFRRNYQVLKAVNEIDLSISKGEIVGYIGANGAGKSTTIKMLTGILVPTGGELVVNGFNPHKQREHYTRNIGVVFGQRSQLWWDIAVIESFRLLQKIYRVPEGEFKSRLANFSEILALGELLHLPVRKLSLGQRMRCELAGSLLHNPAILFLDEPTIGLDVLAKARIRDFLREINDRCQTTIMLTTHDLGDIEALCSRVIILDKGKILFDGSLDGLRDNWGEESLENIVRQIYQGQEPRDRVKVLPVLEG